MYRARAKAPDKISTLSSDELDMLRRQCTEAAHWSKPPEDQKDALATFKSEVKTHYRSVQLRRCCYCSIELQSNHKTFDLEHVLSQIKYSGFMFELLNLAAACTTCNGSKGKKHVLALDAAEEQPSQLPTASEDYVILHPHFDDWQDHLKFDTFSRIVEKDGSQKGRETIKICGIEKLNAARIADQFGQDGQAPAEETLRKLWSLKRKSRRMAMLEALEKIADQTGVESAKIIVRSLKAEG